MANTAQARKRARQAVKQRGHNASLRSELRTAIKKVAKAVLAGDKAAAQTVFNESQGVIDRIADKNIVQEQGGPPQEPSVRGDQGDALKS